MKNMEASINYNMIENQGYMDKFSIILFGLVLNVFTSCEIGNNSCVDKQDPFYSTCGGWDYIRVPLLKPYAAILVDPEIETNTWTVDLLGPGTYSVKRVSVRDSIVYLHCGKIDEKNDSTTIGVKNVPTAWYILDVRNKNEMVFSDFNKFNLYINKNNYPLPKWYFLDSIRDDESLPWIKSKTN